MAFCKVVHTPEMKEAAKRNKEVINATYKNLEVSDNLKNLAKTRSYFIRTYGCQANVRDEETMAGILEFAGFKKANKIEDANIIILNTCAVRENAEDKVFGEIGQLKGIKRKGDDRIIAVCGCMIQQTHIVDIIQDKFRHVDLLFGTHNIDNILNLIEEVYEKKVRVIDVESKMGEVIENLPTTRIDPYKAFVNIMYGCDKFCTYCIVPYTRGKERSRKMEDILKECQELVDKGYQEITLLGQNVNAYGKDLQDGSSFALLLESVAKLGIPRLRFTTSHPWDFTDEMIDIIAKYDNIMKSIHLPVQSGNDEILRLMGRRYSSEQYKQLVDKMKAKIPNLVLTTDIIVGFPNETYEQFADTLKMVEYVKYDGAFTFIYSPRVGTPAAKMIDNVTMEEKHKRFDELVKTVEKYAIPKAEAYVGKTLKVLVDGTSKKNKEVLSGYSEENKLVHFKGDASLVGKIVKVKIKESHLYSVIGELVNE
ncbi:MAG: tRNA (N6-isopentenyl adenosine(37)-C2)-methylthiotransferase MiaB [Erysipelotrichales bacterium]|nr:tRNA (N6-isopentenyl adenosine(37)-C2)-methylthiotransferase MiaB [Erysipelotrichales bacterium]